MFDGAAAAASAASSATARSAYLSRLRRAFLLRAHPDRFRSHPESVRRQQAKLVQAIGSWMTSPAVLDYTSATTSGRGSRRRSAAGGTDDQAAACAGGVHRYVLERSDGSLLRRTMRLDDTVENVLGGMSDALEELGVKTPVPPPPPPPPPRTPWEGMSPPSHGGPGGVPPPPPSFKHPPGATRDMYENMYRFVWTTNRRTAAASGSGEGSHDDGDAAARDGVEVDPRFDVVSRRGRDLMDFLRNHLDRSEVERRRASRLDAVAAALVARRAYRFEAVDGTGLGWSSSNVAAVLASLTDLREEYGSNLNVRSFHPLRLVLSSDEFEEEVCLYGGGRVTLNPAATPLQWLRTLMTVTDESLRIAKHNRDELDGFTDVVQDVMHVRIRRGHSCNPRDYHECLDRLASAAEGARSDKSLAVSSSALAAARRIRVIVEGPHACRRAVVTGEGDVRVGSGMSADAILSSIGRLSTKAATRAAKEAERLEDCSDMVERLKILLNVDKITRASTAPVTTVQMLKCLGELIAKAATNSDMMTFLGGQSIQIGGSGQFCHLSDDGSVVIPWDFR